MNVTWLIRGSPVLSFVASGHHEERVTTASVLEVSAAAAVLRAPHPLSVSDADSSSRIPTHGEWSEDARAMLSEATNATLRFVCLGGADVKCKIDFVSSC